MDDLGLVEIVDRFGESVVVGIADASNRRLDARLRKPFGIANGHILRATVGMINQPATVNGPSIRECMIEGIEHKARRSSPACPIAGDTVSKRINDEARNPATSPLK